MGNHLLSSSNTFAGLIKVKIEASFYDSWYVWQVQTVNRDRVGWTGVNSVDVNWIVYRELAIWRALMTKANFQPWTCLWHWTVKNPSRIKHTDSGEVLFIKIYILQCHWLLLFIMLFGTIARNSNLWWFYNFKTLSLSITVSLIGYVLSNCRKLRFVRVGKCINIMLFSS